MALSSYFMEQFVKLKILTQFEAMKSSILTLDEKALVTLLVNLYL